MALRPETKVLREFQREFPYNNLSSMFLARGEKVSEKFGGPCLTGAALLGRRLEDRVRDVRAALHNDMGMDDDGHVVASTYDGEEFKLYDPSFLMQEPLSLTRVKEGDDTPVKTYPEIDGRCRTIEFLSTMDPYESGVLLLKSEDGAVVHTNQVMTGEPIRYPSEPFPFSRRMAGKARSTLVLHALDAKHRKSEVTLETRTGRMAAGHVGPGLKKVPETKRALFDHELARIARQIGVTKKQLEEFFREGWETYKEIHPDYGNPRPRLFS